MHTCVDAPIYHLLFVSKCRYFCSNGSSTDKHVRTESGCHLVNLTQQPEDCRKIPVSVALPVLFVRVPDVPFSSFSNDVSTPYQMRILFDIVFPFDNMPNDQIDNNYNNQNLRKHLITSDQLRILSQLFFA